MGIFWGNYWELFSYFITVLSHSVMIMMSEDMRNGSGGGGGGATAGSSITNPFVTQTYRCVAPYETKDTKNRPFKVAVDEKLDVLIKDPAGQCFHIPENRTRIKSSNHLYTYKPGL